MDTHAGGQGISQTLIRSQLGEDEGPENLQPVTGMVMCILLYQLQRDQYFVATFLPWVEWAIPTTINFSVNFPWTRHSMINGGLESYPKDMSLFIR